ncbi:hypothetical protein ATKI12_2195 [Kitasatospora sp. Ki12]
MNRRLAHSCCSFIVGPFEGSPQSLIRVVWNNRTNSTTGSPDRYQFDCSFEQTGTRHPILPHRPRPPRLPLTRSGPHR